MKITRSFTIDSDVFEKLKNHATKTNTPFSNIIEKSILNTIENDNKVKIDKILDKVKGVLQNEIL